MGSKKGQLFLVAIVFLIGLLFVIQQSLFQYSEITMSEPFDERSIETIENILGVINQTVRETHYCNETEDSLSKRMEELKLSLLEEFGRTHKTEIVYAINCTNWENTYGPSPLRVTIAISGLGKDTRGTFDFYHL